MKSFPRKPLALALLAALSATSAHAIQIDEMPLTSAPAPAAAAQAAAPAIPSRPVVPMPSGPARAPSAAPSNPAWDLYQQLDALRTTVAQLQGQVEEQQQTIDKLSNDLKVRYTDLDQRVDALSQPQAAAATGAAASLPANDGPDPVATPSAVTPAVAPAATTIPVAAPVAAAVAVQPAPAAAPAPAPAQQNLTPDEIERQKKAYLAAYQRFKGEGPAAAIKAMQAFVQQNPDSVFAPNAYYWTGEFQLALDTPDYDGATANFGKVLSDFGTSAKAAAADYKLGTIADLRNQPDEARKRMTDVITRFPGTPEARLAQSWLTQNPTKK